MPGYLPSPTGGCIPMAVSSSLVGGTQPQFPPGIPLLPQPTAPVVQPPLPAVSSSRIATPQEQRASAANTTGLAIAGVLAGGALLLFLLD